MGRGVAAARVASSLVVVWLVCSCAASPSSLPPPGVHDQARAYATFMEAERLRRSGDLGAAALQYVEVVRLDPGAWTPRVVLAEVLRDSGQFEDALFAVDGARPRGAPEEVWVPLKAELLVASGREAEAVELYRAWRDADRSLAWFRGWQGVALAAEEAVSGAAREATEAFAQARPHSAEPWRAWARHVREVEGDLAGARALDAVLERRDATAADAALQVRLYVSGGDGVAAEASAAACVERFASHLPCHRERVALVDRHALPADAVSEEARAVVRAFAMQASRAPRGVIEEGFRLVESTRPALAEVFALEAAALRPASARHLEQAAWVALEAGRWQTAAELMERVIELEPRNPDALNFVGYTWADNGVRLEEAELLIRDALALRPGDAAILDSLAWVLHRQGRSAEALPVQREAVSRDERHAVLHDHLAQILDALGDREGAIESWRRALEVAGPRDGALVRSIEERLEALGLPPSWSSPTRER
ncbi:MAG: hypothetical protein EA398_13110 [Deltaproteobacteria bacterium]|nr:MAG: hypothetical protein EA398_13110 [Deltaproteobacteria bacterium]